MKTLRLILGDQLSLSLPSLRDAKPGHDVLVMAEVWDEATYVPHHPKKIALIFAAMRHFAKELQAAGFEVVYSHLDDAHNTGTLQGEVARLLKQHAVGRIVLTHPGEYRLLQAMQQWQEKWGIPVEIREDDRFLCTLDTFAQWAEGRQQLRMEYFYRQMRKQYGVLLDASTQPIGGKWNFDASNRKPPKSGLLIPKPWVVEVDDITAEVLQLVEARFGHHFGDLLPFHFAVTRTQALQVLTHFIDARLAAFGDYQDAMLEDEPWMYHSHISFYLNCGLLLPMECISAAEQAYHDGKAPLNAVEGFIRQILGWREYVRGIYWLKMPDYADANYLQATRQLPEFYWSGNTRMNCLRQCVSQTKAHAYAHHIQRLMVLGNFALLAGLAPQEVNRWFLIVYADAYEWVELPNVSGMILFADGGYLASKPYAAGGAYIQKMSNYCQGCSYKVQQKNGEDACPFNYLYWGFLARHRQLLGRNQRLAMMYKSYDRMNEEKQAMIAADNARFLAQLEAGDHV